MKSKNFLRCLFAVLTLTLLLVTAQMPVGSNEAWADPIINNPCEPKILNDTNCSVHNNININANENKPEIEELQKIVKNNEDINNKPKIEQAKETVKNTQELNYNEDDISVFVTGIIISVISTLFAGSIIILAVGACLLLCFYLLFLVFKILFWVLWGAFTLLKIALKHLVEKLTAINFSNT